MTDQELREQILRCLTDFHFDGRTVETADAILDLIKEDQRALLKEVMEAVDAGYGYCGCASIVEGFMARLTGGE